jgi:hypothetical protein
MRPITATFRFGDRQQHVSRFEGGYFGGERYYVNDKLVLEQRNMSMRGAQTFEAEGHRIEFRVLLSLRDAKGEAYVDGKLVASDLFADFNERIKPARGGMPSPAMKLVYEIGLWVLLVLVLTLVFQSWR